MSAKKIQKEENFEVFDELDEDDFYNETEIESLLEDDEISDEEEAFMIGYMESENEQ